MKECFTFTKQLVSVILLQNDFFQSYRKSKHVADTAHREHLQKPDLRFIRTYKFGLKMAPTALLNASRIVI